MSADDVVSEATPVPEGIAASAVTGWLRERTEATPPLGFEVIAGGRSNLTYTVTDAAGRRWVLRRPPLHSVLASAHDVGREHRIMAALQDTVVPVPPLVGMEADEGGDGGAVLRDGVRGRAGAA